MIDFYIQVEQGGDYVIEIACFDASDNSQEDFTNDAAITMVVKDYPTGTTYISKSLASGINVGSPAHILEITLTSTDLSISDMPPGEYVFELKATDLSGNDRYVRDFYDNPGKFIVKETLHRD